MVTMDQKKVIEQFLNYLIVGGVAFVFDFLTLYVLTEYVHIQYLISAACAFIVGLNVNYILAKYLVFKTSKIKNTYKEYLAVFIISLSGLLLNQFFIWVSTEKLGIYYLYSKLITAGIILMYNFIIRKIFVFD